MIVFIHFLAQRVCRTKINTLDAWQHPNGGVMTCCFLPSTGQKNKNKNKNTAWVTASKGLDASTFWKKADWPQMPGHLSLWEESTWPQCSVPQGRPSGKLKFALRANGLYSLCLHKCWALSSLTRVFVRKKKPGRETSQQRKDLGKTCPEGDRNARLRRQPPSLGEAAQTVTWLGRQVDVWQARACGKCTLGSQGSWNEACHFRRREGGRKGGEKCRARFVLT